MAAGSTAGATTWRLQVQAGPHSRHAAPLCIGAPGGAPAGAYRLRYPGGTVWAQVQAGELLAVLPALAAGERRVCTVEASDDAESLALARHEGDRIDVAVDGSPVGSLQLAAGPKPFLHPVLLPGGQALTRRIPPDGAKGDVQDHPHHQGLWVGHGDVDGVDTWANNPRNLGREVVRAVSCDSGPVAARIALDLAWTAPDGREVMLEQRTYRFWHSGPDRRLIDVSSRFRGAGAAPVRFGDTKEGALCCIRLAAGMEGDRGGLITTSTGGRTEEEAWGRPAVWCDYSGQPFADDGHSRLEMIGVALFDHPDNPLFPTRWHVRDYGLFTANPFGLHDYRPGRGEHGDWTIPAGTEATFRYRIYAHTGDADLAAVRAHYADWAWPVKATLAD